MCTSHLYIYVCTYIYVFCYASRGFGGLGLGLMLLMFPLLLESKATDCGETFPFCCLSQRWFLYLQIFQPEEPTSYTSRICHPVTSSSRKAALGEGICVGTGKSAGEDLGNHPKAMELHKKQLHSVVILYIWYVCTYVYAYCRIWYECQHIPYLSY